MEGVAKFFLLLVFIGSTGFGMSYYFFYEQATICSVEHEGSHIINNYCECEGWEVTRRNTLDKDGGIKETVCIGRVSERYCTRKLEGKVFETDCE